VLTQENSTILQEFEDEDAMLCWLDAAIADLADVRAEVQAQVTVVLVLCAKHSDCRKVRWEVVLGIPIKAQTCVVLSRPSTELSLQISRNNCSTH
jgi:hypothetical protein